MNFLKYTSALFMTLLMSNMANAALITTEYHHIDNNSWVVDLTLVGDGSPADVQAFTTYFSHESFADLILVGFPVSWDTIVIQPNVDLSFDGFLDAYMIDGVGLSAGQMQSGFSVQFSYLGLGMPGKLAFDIVDFDYQIVFQGETESKPMTSVVSEPGMLGLMLAGLFLIFGRFRYLHRAKHSLNVR